MTARGLAKAQFIAAAGWAQAQAVPLAGDASSRSYTRLILGERRAIVMDAPPGSADDPAQFLAIAQHLASLGLSPPRCLAQDLAQGFLLLEDLGDDLFARVLAKDPAREADLYTRAVDVLVHLQSHPAPQGLPDEAADNWAEAALLCLTQYRHAIAGDAGDLPAFRRALTHALTRYANGPRVLILRDYHAENLLDLQGRGGIASVGLLDFQLGQMGQPCYDLVSLCQDARRDVSAATETAMIARFARATGADLAPFRASYAVFGAQRGLRILGIFAQLCTRDGKPQYLDLIPRVWAQVQRNLAHPALQDLAQVCATLLPPPTTAALQTLRSQCKTPV